MADSGLIYGHSSPLRRDSHKSGSVASGGKNALPALLLLAGLFLPPEMGISPGGVAITPGRVGVLLLLLPALFVLLGKRRHRLSSDYWVFATASWMTGAAIYVSSINALWSAPGGESLEFLGSYLIARAFIFGPASLNQFMRVLRFVAAIVIILALAEFVAGRLIVRDTIAAIVGVKSATAGAIFRGGMIRAVSTFEHPILFGSFCPLVLALLLYWERSAPRRFLWVILCLAGVLASLTSIALLSFVIAVGCYAYDQFMRGYRWRWKAVWSVLIIAFSSLFLLSNAPLGWLITHLTFDPESGYFRFLIWDAALTYIDQAPLTGYAYTPLHHSILDYTVDSVWLVTCLRYGIPAIVFLFLANLTSFFPIKNGSLDPSMTKMSTAFTIALVLFMFIGLTVHYWNFLWIFWGACIGIRASLRELSLSGSDYRVRSSRPAAFQAS